VLVSSYLTVSPLPARRSGPAVCSLWHCPAGRPGLPLATTLLCGVRTFLGGAPKGTDATARSTRPSRRYRTVRRGVEVALLGLVSRVFATGPGAVLSIPHRLAARRHREQAVLVVAGSRLPVDSVDHEPV
jgi:hypothetical protein